MEHQRRTTFAPGNDPVASAFPAAASAADVVRPPRAAIVLAGLFWLSVIGTTAASLVLALMPRPLAFDLGSAPDVGRIGRNIYRADFHRPIPDDCALRRSGRDLPRVSSAGDVSAITESYALDAEAGVVVWSSSDDALARKELFSYTLTAHPRRRVLSRRLPLVLLAGALGIVLAGTVVVAFGGRTLNRGSQDNVSSVRGRLMASIDLERALPVPGRIAATLVCGTCLAASLVPNWNRLVSAPDSNSYVTHSEMRTPLVPYWIDAFDSRPEVDRSRDLFDELGVVNHWGGSHRFIGAVRAWKVLLVAAATLLVWELTSFLRWWQVGAVVCAAAALDAALGPWSRGFTGYLDVVLSEGMSQALTFACLALTAGYLRSPGWTRGLLLALCVNLLLLARPGNVPFLAVFGVLAIFHLVRDGFRAAALRAGLLGGATAAGILAHCAMNYALHGHFKQHAFTGFNLMTTTLQLATPADAELFAEPELREFVRVCTVDLAAKRSPELTDAAATQNCWQIACPAYARVFGQTVFVDPYHADEVFTTVARGLLRRHAAPFARQAAASLARGFWTTWLHVPLLVVIGLSLRSFLRTGSWPYLYVAWLAVLPFLTVGPCCLTNSPLDRYRSQTYFAELWSAPLWLGLVLANRRARGNEARGGAAHDQKVEDDEAGRGEPKCYAPSPVSLRLRRRIPLSQRS